MRFVLTVAVVVAGPTLLMGAGCAEGGPARCNLCFEVEPARFVLACSPNDLASVVTTGPCAVPEAGTTPAFAAPVRPPDVGVFGSGEGTCHIELTFASGFIYATDVSFMPENAGCPGCPALFEPTSGPFIVPNPPSTCIYALPEAGSTIGSLVNPDAGGGDAPGE